MPKESQIAKLEWNEYVGEWQVRALGRLVTYGQDKKEVCKTANDLGYTLLETK